MVQNYSKITQDAKVASLRDVISKSEISLANYSVTLTKELALNLLPRNNSSWLKVNNINAIYARNTKTIVRSSYC